MANLNLNNVVVKTFSFRPNNTDEMYTMVATAVVSDSDSVNVSYVFPFMFKDAYNGKYSHYKVVLKAEVDKWATENNYTVHSY